MADMLQNKEVDLALTTHPLEGFESTVLALHLRFGTVLPSLRCVMKNRCRWCCWMILAHSATRSLKRWMRRECVAFSLRSLDAFCCSRGR
ncbi:Uncharacterised protein [Kluyvera cryocrescens]|uniref:Uncharacterized protein n=1 Tax=Kluyvera cryocrescens TaxID=580 RepID=A0A485ATV3_KLUCR|nr:Uncharacterised protein [Kluyvera cryocrescens]